MSKAGARNVFVVSAMVVAGIRLWMQLRGKTKTPFSEWAIGWGALFFILSILAEAAPTAAGSLAMLVAFSDFLANGVSLTTDVSNVITSSEKGGQPGNVFVQTPFASAPSTGKVKGA